MSVDSIAGGAELDRVVVWFMRQTRPSTALAWRYEPAEQMAEMARRGVDMNCRSLPAGQPDLVHRRDGRG